MLAKRAYFLCQEQKRDVFSSQELCVLHSEVKITLLHVQCTAICEEHILKALHDELSQAKL